MESQKFEHRKALKVDLLAFWTWVRTELSDETKTKDAALINELDRLLKDDSEDFSWVQCNRAELLMLPLLPEPALDAQLRRRLDQALEVGAISADQYEELAARFFNRTPPARAAEKCEGARVLLSKLHQFFLNRRFRRDQRAEAARILKWFALWILVLGLLPITVFTVVDYVPWQGMAKGALVQVPLFCAAAAGSFGIIGAFFSRLISFQRRVEAFGFEQILNTFSTQVIILRCATGMFGAVLFYFLMRSGLLGGSLFLVENGDTSLYFAKLLVWSFVAGWSERLVPETLERTENSAKSSQAPAKSTGG